MTMTDFDSKAKIFVSYVIPKHLRVESTPQENHEKRRRRTQWSAAEEGQGPLCHPGEQGGKEGGTFPRKQLCKSGETEEERRSGARSRLVSLPAERGPGPSD